MTAREDHHRWFVARRRVLAEVLTRRIDPPQTAR